MVPSLGEKERPSHCATQAAAAINYYKPCHSNTNYYSSFTNNVNQKIYKYYQSVNKHRPLAEGVWFTLFYKHMGGHSVEAFKFMYSNKTPKCA